jgi:4-hydroxy-tetrahydrodipicolinate reductase
MNGLRIAIAGAGGRMGRMLIEATLHDAEATLVAASTSLAYPAEGKDAGELVGMPCGVPVSSDCDAGIARAKLPDRFHAPRGDPRHLAICRRHGVAMVIGTTGFDAAGKEAIAAAAQDIPVVFAPNMSVGVNVVFKLLDVAARILGEGYDVEIVEAHHRHKVDAPSGTALRMGEVVAQALGRDLQGMRHLWPPGRHRRALAVDHRFCHRARRRHRRRSHTVMFCGLGERVEIGHKASSRMPYALGSLRAARFWPSRAGGLFDMQDVLGLR